MISVPAVNPGDTVFWHCDVVHSVEQEHTGAEDSAGGSRIPSVTLRLQLIPDSFSLSVIMMYIPAVPLTPANARYVEQQKEHFLKGVPPPDFPVAVTGVRLMGLASDEDVEEPLGRKAMGLPIAVA
jgi:hypothetical protein